jgi:cell pole-organizing protein PopZ
MTVASAFVPQQSDPAGADMRRQEPSMEDILASIRRIIADDQTQGQRSGYSGSEDGSPTASATAQPEPDRPGENDLPAERPAEQPQTDHDAVLDLATMPEAAFPEGGRSSFGELRPIAVETTADAAEAGEEPAEEPATIARAPLRPSDVAFGEISAAYRSRQDAAPVFRMPRSEQELAHPELTPMDYKALEAPAFRPDPPEASSLHDDEPMDSGDALISPSLGASVMSAFETLAATVVLQNNDMLERMMRELLRPLVKTWLDENLPTLVERLVRNEIERVARGGRG